MLGTKWEITANVPSPLVAASHPHPRTQLRGDQVRKNYLEGMVSPTCHVAVGQGTTDAQAGKSRDLIWCVFSLSLSLLLLPSTSDQFNCNSNIHVKIIHPTFHLIWADTQALLNAMLTVKPKGSI